MTASHVTDDGGFQTASSSSAPGGIGRCGDEPTFSRREVLGLLGIASAAVVGGCSGPWAVPEGLVKKALRGPGLVSEVETVCGLCPGACGLTVRLVDGLPVGLKGNPNHPLNRGGLCPVGMAGLEVLYAPNRLRHPLRKGPGGGFRRVEWDQALEEIARRLKESAAKSDQIGSVAAICGPSSLLFQDLVEHLAGRMGRFQCLFTDQENALPYALTQGLDGLPALDWSGSDLVLSFGFDLFEDGPAPIHAISALIGTRETQERARLLYAGTRCSPSASKADLFVPVRPGTLGALALGVAHVLVREGRYDSRFVAEHTFGFEDGLLDGSETLGFRRLLLERYYPDRIAQICGCPAASIVRLARRFAQASHPLAIAGGEAVEGTNATWNVMAVHSLNALIGAFGRPGGVLPRPSLPLSPLPGSAETGTVPPTPHSPGAEERGLLGSEPLEAFSRAVLDGSQAVEVLFVIGDDPVRRQPSGSLLAQALKKIPVVVSLTPFLDETGRDADWVLPTPVPLEGWQDSTTPSFSALSVLGIARPVIEPLYESRHAGDILLELGSRAALADNSLPWKSYSQYLRDRLNGLARSGQGTLISGSFEESWRRFLEERGWRFLQHQGIDEFWPDLLRQSGWWNLARFQGDWTRLFPSPSGRYEFFSQQLYRKLLEYGGGLSSSAGAEAALNRGRQTLGLQGEVEELCLPHYEPPQQTGQGELILIPFRPVTSRGRLATASPMVMEMFGHSVLAGWQTWAELSPQTATGLDLEEGDLVALETDRGQIEAVVRIQAGAASEAVHVPLGLGWVPALPSEAAGANPCKILLPAHDPISGAFSRCSTRVRIRLLRRRPYGGPAPHDSGGRT